MEDASKRLARYQQAPTDVMEFRVERGRIEPGRSFSAEAMKAVTDEVILFIGARIMAAWQRRDEPPSVATIRVEVTAQ